MSVDFNFPYTIQADTPAVASQVQSNFADFLAWVKAYYKQAADTTTEISTTALLLDGSNAMAADLAMGSNKITGLAAPVATTDATTKTYVDNVSIDTSNVSGYTMENGLTDRGPNGTADLTAGTFNLGSTGTYKILWNQAFGVTTFNIRIVLGTGGGFGTWASGIQLPAVLGGTLSSMAWQFPVTFNDASTGRLYQGVARNRTLGDDYLALYYITSTNGEMAAISSSFPFSWTAGDSVDINGVAIATFPEF